MFPVTGTSVSDFWLHLMTVAHTVLDTRSQFLLKQCFRECGSKGSTAMLAVKRLAGVALEVNLRYPLHTGNTKHIQYICAIYPGLETQGRCHQKSQQGCQWPYQKDLALKKERYWLIHTVWDQKWPGQVQRTGPAQQETCGIPGSLPLSCTSVNVSVQYIRRTHWSWSHSRAVWISTLMYIFHENEEKIDLTVRKWLTCSTRVSTWSVVFNTKPSLVIHLSKIFWCVAQTTLISQNRWNLIKYTCAYVGGAEKC